MTETNSFPIATQDAQSVRNVEIFAASKEVETSVSRFVEQLAVIADPGWLSVARVHFEQGFLAANRAVSQAPR